MLYIPLIVGISLVAFGYTQDLELQTVSASSKGGFRIAKKQKIQKTIRICCLFCFLFLALSTTIESSASSYSTSPQTSRTTQTVEYETCIQKAIAWLITQREPNWGWRNDTPKVLVALQMAQNDELAGLLPSQLETQLSSKQMEVEIVTLLWR